MSSLLLVRHGQASAHDDDYDQLSPLGARQAQALGRALAEARATIDAAYVGPRRRHLHTFEHVRGEAARHALSIPEPAMLPAFDEVDVGGVLAQAWSRVLPSCPTLRDQLKSGVLADEAKEARRHLFGVTAKLFERWAGGEELGLGVEPFEIFAARVHAGLHEVMRAEKRGKRVLVVTSGGPIAVAVRLALGLDPQRSLALLWRIANASVTELRFTESQLSLETFNHYGHLLAESLVTRI